MKHFCQSYNMKSLIKVSACYKNSQSPSCIDLTLTNKPRNFQNSSVIENSLSYFHKMTVTALRMQFHKLKPRVLLYRETFINSFKAKLNIQSIYPVENGFLNFCKICTETLNNHAPRKRKTIRWSQSPFMNKEISVTISVTNLWNIKQMKVGKHLLSNVIIASLF